MHSATRLSLPPDRHRHVTSVKCRGNRAGHHRAARTQCSRPYTPSSALPPPATEFPPSTQLQLQSSADQLRLLAAESLHGRWRTDLTMELDFGTTMMGCRNPTPTDVFLDLLMEISTRGMRFAPTSAGNDGTRGWTVFQIPSTPRAFLHFSSSSTEFI